MRGPITIRVLLLLALSAAGLPVASGSEPVGAETPNYACAVLLVETPSWTNEERDLLCDAAEKALAFFDSYGIGIEHVIRLRIEREPLSVARPHLGSYSSTTKNVRLLGLDQVAPHHALFGLPLDRQLYESVAVHELAHAIAAQHFNDRETPVVFQEYLAYVVQLSTMAPDLRARILIRHDGAAFEAMEDLSWTFYAMAPSEFGVMAYRHFSTVAEPRRLIHRLLSGDIRPPCHETE